MSNPERPAILGFTHQSTDNTKLANHFKLLEEGLHRLLDLAAGTDLDPRWVAIARTHFHEGFMALNRSNFKPQRIEGHIDFNDVIDGAGAILKDRKQVSYGTTIVQPGSISIAGAVIASGSINSNILELRK